MKLIIDIPKGTYEAVRVGTINQVLEYKVWNAIQNGTPLDDVKAEIEQIYQGIDTISHNEYENAVEQGKEITYENVLSILDNIGKGDKECWE